MSIRSRPAGFAQQARTRVLGRGKTRRSGGEVGVPGRRVIGSGCRAGGRCEDREDEAEADEGIHGIDHKQQPYRAFARRFCDVLTRRLNELCASFNPGTCARAPRPRAPPRQATRRPPAHRWTRRRCPRARRGASGLRTRRRGRAAGLGPADRAPRAERTRRRPVRWPTSTRVYERIPVTVAYVSAARKTTAASSPSPRRKSAAATKYPPTPIAASTRERTRLPVSIVNRATERSGSSRIATSAAVMSSPSAIDATRRRPRPCSHSRSTRACRIVLRFQARAPSSQSPCSSTRTSRRRSLQRDVHTWPSAKSTPEYATASVAKSAYRKTGP